ncbi:MAG: hypothetical protein AAGB04_25675 [Pseudomonadota bacterium]
MQKSEKTAEPSMEEILASIRKIIAEEPPQAPQVPTATPAAAQPELARRGILGKAHPPGDDLSDILEEPSAGAKDQKVAESSASVPEPEVAPVSSPVPEAGLERPATQSVDDETQESPLMARLRGLAGAPNTLAREPEVRPDTIGLGLGEQESEPTSGLEPTAAKIPSADAPSGAAPLAASPSTEAESRAEPEQAKASDTAAPTDGAASIFGKSAAAGVDPVAISIASEEASGAVTDPAPQNLGEADLPSVSSFAKSDTALEQPERPASAVDNVFASLTEAPVAEEVAEAQEQPVLPHQEFAESNSQPPAEDTQPEPFVAAPAIATADASKAIEEKQPTANVGQRADLEVALAALMEPMVERWLQENVPGIVERVLAEKMNDK